MSKPKLDRNYEIVQLRTKDPQKWTWRALQKKYKFKSHNRPKQIFYAFKDKF